MATTAKPPKIDQLWEKTPLGMMTSWPLRLNSQAIISVESSAPVVSRWLGHGNRTFLEVASTVVTWWIVAFLRSGQSLGWSLNSGRTVGNMNVRIFICCIICFMSFLSAYDASDNHVIYWESLNVHSNTNTKIQQLPLLIRVLSGFYLHFPKMLLSQLFWDSLNTHQNTNPRI